MDARVTPTAASARPTAGELAGVAALAAVTLATSWLSFTMTRFGGVSSLWIANGLLAGALLLTARTAWPWLFAASGLAQMGARLLVGDAWLLVLALPLVNLLEAGIVGYWVRRDEEDLRRARSLGKVSQDSLASTIVACLLSATIALPVLLTRPGASALVSWGTWFTAHLLGMVVVATLTVCAFQQGVHLLGERGRRADFALCLALLLATCALAFGQSSYALLFLVYLPLLLISWRHGLSGMVVGIVVVAATSGFSATRGAGSFSLSIIESPVGRLLYWQVFLAAGCLLAFSTAVAMVQRRQGEARLLASQARLQALTDALPAMVARFDREGRYTYANPRSRQMFPGVELIGKTLAEVRPERAEALAPIIDAVLRGEPQDYETQLRLPDRVVDLNVQFVPDRASDGSVQGFYSLSFDLSAQKNAERELARQARVDALTGLANRRQFEERLAERVARARRTGQPLMVAALDLDRFKQINDTLGHAAGDEVLVEFGRRVSASVFSDVDLVARLGGDEFVVLIEYSASVDAGQRLACRIIEAMAAPIALADGGSVQAATSIGIGLQRPVTSAEALLGLADKALYEAKAKGRNTFAIASEPPAGI